MQGFEAKKRLLSAYLSSILYTLYSSITRIRNPSANWTRVRWLEAGHDNHYTTQLATMQWQNAVFKPNVREKGNGTWVSFAWLDTTGRHYGWDYFWEYSGSLDFLVTQTEFRNGAFWVLSIVVFKMPSKNIKIQLSWPVSVTIGI